MPGKPKIITIPDGGWGDTATNFGRYYNKLFVTDYARQLGFDVVELDGADAHRAFFEKAMSGTQGAKAAFGTGHGNERAYAGFQNELLLDNENIRLVAGKICSWISCKFGLSGDKRLAAGMIAEISSRVNIYFNIDHQNPKEDGRCRQYAENWHAADRALLEGKNHEAAFQVQIAQCVSNIEKAAPIDKYYQQYFLDGLQRIGDKTAMLTEPTQKNHVEVGYGYVSGEAGTMGHMATPDGIHFFSEYDLPHWGNVHLWYIATRADGQVKEKATGQFTLKEPVGGMEITLIKPVGGEVYESKHIEAEVTVKWE